MTKLMLNFLYLYELYTNSQSTKQNNYIIKFYTVHFNLFTFFLSTSNKSKLLEEEIMVECM